MSRIVIWSFGLAGLAILCRCQRGELTAVEINCSPAGHWLAEDQRQGGDCPPGLARRTSVVLDIAELDMTEQGSLWGIEVSRDGQKLESCSGTTEDACRFEITCHRTFDDRRIDYAIAIEVTEAGTRSGSNVLTLASDGGEKCEAHFTLDGELVSPRELERAQEGDY